MTSPRQPTAAESAADPVAMPTGLVEQVGDWLEVSIGLDCGRVGRNAVARAVSAAWPDAARTTSETVAGWLAGDSPERQRLIDAIVVSESWFLREPRVFDHVTTVVRTRLEHQRQVTLLSAPCAAGEEAYSLAVALLQAGIAAERFRIIAADLSPRAIAAARRGVFTENAFRAAAADLRPSWFTATAAGWAVSDAVRQPVHFLEANLLDPASRSRLRAEAGGPFDLICCRNLLIYLTAQARQAVEQTLAELLAPEGEVIVGAAEAVILPAGRWQPTGPLAFGRRTQAAGEPPLQTLGPRATPPLRPRPAARPQPTPRLPQPPARPAAPVATATGAAPPAPAEPVAEAERLANSGDIDAAIAACQRALDANPAQPAVLFLAAMLKQSVGADAAAQRLLEKVVYLEPTHEAALLALALAAGRRGDTAAERRYRRRASAAESAS